MCQSACIQSEELIELDTHEDSWCQCGHPGRHHYYYRGKFRGRCGGFGCLCSIFEYEDWVTDFCIIPESMRALPRLGI